MKPSVSHDVADMNVVKWRAKKTQPRKESMLVMMQGNITAGSGGEKKRLLEVYVAAHDTASIKKYCKKYKKKTIAYIS